MIRWALLLVACTSPNPELAGTFAPASEFPAVDPSPSAEVAIGAPCDPDGAGCAKDLACCRASIDLQKRMMCLPPGWCDDDEDKGEKHE
jgi:hypothetical protein